MKQTVLDQHNSPVSEIELSDAIFAVPPNMPLVYESVKMILANRRRGTAATKNTALVHGTTAKMYRQKGTGRARHSSYKMNIFVGGGQAFGPQPRDYSYAIPKRARRQALCSALAVKHAEGKMMVVDRLELPTSKTKLVVEILGRLGVSSALIVADGMNEKLDRSVRNIPGVKLVTPEAVNVVDLVTYEYLVMTQSALENIEKRLTA